MKRIQRWKRLLAIGVFFSMTLVGCNQVQNKPPEETKPITPEVTASVTGESIYNQAYEEYSNLTDFGVVINSPTADEMSRLETVKEYEYGDHPSEEMLFIPKYNGTKIAVYSVEYTGERYIQKDELYCIDATSEGEGLLLKADRPEGMAQIGVFVTYQEKTVLYPIETTNGKDGNIDREYLQLETEKKQPNEWEMIMPEADADTYLEGMNCVERFELDFDKDGSMESIEVYSDAKVDKSGKLLLDDGQGWALILRKNDEVFPLFEKSFIQLGGLEYVVFEDCEEHERTHIIVTYDTGVTIMYYDCTFDEESGYIRRQSVYTANNINKLMSWSYKNCD